jgi:LacI family transcriptional regulator
MARDDGEVVRLAARDVTPGQQESRLAERSPRRTRSAATISDVAREAGVSTMTVSRVINDSSNVREKTRSKVEAAIAALNYSPSAAARSLAAAGEIRIGLLYSNPSAAYLSEFLVGGLSQASRSNVQFVVEQCDDGDGNGEVEAATRLVQQRIDGVVLPPPLCDSAAVHRVLNDANVPAVAVATGRPGPDMAAVSIDDHRAAYAMTQHLAALGHRRIGFIIGNPNQTASLRRLEGYREAMIDAGLAIDDALIEQGLFTYRSGLDATERMLELDDAPSAVFASNDDMAAAAVAIAHRRGLDVPSDLTVVGFDDTALATTIWPELTTIHQPIIEMSRAAVEMLVQAIRDRRQGAESSARHVVLDFTLVRRQSDAAPRRRPPSR